MHFSRKHYDALSALLKDCYGFEVRRKQSSPLMWLVYVVSFMWIWNRRFMTDYTTTIFGRVYFPDGYVESDPGSAAVTLAHEGVHLHDAHANEPQFSLWYLFPVCLLAVSWVGFLFLPWFLALPVLLAPLVPWPAPGRVHYERRGYTMSAVCALLAGQQLDEDYVCWMAGHFGGWGYYKMSWTDGTTIAREIIADAEAIVAGTRTDLYHTTAMRVLLNA